MRNIFMLLSALVGFFSFACAIENDAAQTSQMEPMPIISASVADTQAVGEKIEFQAVAQTPNPCWKFNRFDIAQSDSEVNVKVLAEYDDNSPCEQVIDTLNANGSVMLMTPGVYTLKFWRGDEGMLTRQVVVQ